MQSAPNNTAPASAGNRLFPLSPKAIRLLRAHDAESASVVGLSKGTGEPKDASI
ncbi:hypothetical protein AB3Y40_17170 [Yoonia sp. R2331]|uniref:hypothetical protein n=1 Tax=Yoonia sp. R2331 TaxID=3237238 RepID=UPI0034E3B4D1